MVKKIILAFIIGFLGVIFFAQYDVWTHKKIVALLQKVARESLDGNISCTVQSVNFFAPSLVLHDVVMQSLESDLWSWRCKKCEVSCSWIQLLFSGTIDQYVVIDGFEAKSRIENSHFLIEPHVMAMMQNAFVPFPTDLKSIVFRNAYFYANDEQYKGEVSFFFNSSSLRIGRQIKTTMSVVDGSAVYENNKYVENIAADVSVTTQYGSDQLEIGAQVAGTFVLPHMGNQGGCYITGVWKSDRGRFSVHNAYNSLIIDPIIITEHELRANGRFPLSYAAQCIGHAVADQVIDGNVHFTVKINKNEPFKVDGQVVAEGVTCNDHYVCDTGKIIFGCYADDWKARFAISRYNQECKGTGYWHASAQKGELVIKNVTELSAKALPYWRIKPNNFFAHVTADHDTVTGSYDIVASNTLSDAVHGSNATFSLLGGVATIKGLVDAQQFFVEGLLFPELQLHHCVYKDKDDQELIGLHVTEDKKQVQGSVAFSFIRSLINHMLNYDLQGEGKLDVVAALSPAEITADFMLNDTTIRLPQTYNFIDGFNAHCVYNIPQKSLVLEDVNLSLYTGKINCLRATAHFDNSGSLVFAHAPLILDNCLLNIKRDLFATVFGNLLFSKTSSSCARVDGHIIIDKAQLKENLFSGIIQKQLLSYTHSVFSFPDVPLLCDLTIETKAPIVVDTGFFQTNAHVNLRVQKETQDPVVTGAIVLNGGTLNFPYKPLYISKGVIIFSPEQLFDPTIEFVARNKIKKYDVSLQVEGSLLTHHVALGATPPLTEEQIVALLLVGTEENSLNSMMPALIVQNLKSLIFSNNQSSFFDKYFKPLLGSFNINLVPSFTDQSGRGGLRGALEITLDDRWRAVIQKNFSLTEDTKFELEFLLSDDITLRAIRDERRDLGGEVEMRWKF